MCDDEPIPPRPDLTEQEWLWTAPRTPAGGPPPRANGRVPGHPGRRAVLGGAMAGAALTVGRDVR
ncbi:hypothetical protein ACO0M4_09455 [Streptomyces sp. RGM 3693]|uniref:hypothetical protein n=1 Tax=Streptomyces sp. RGM 3693 TaxID=3413284 RepID=UPI003D27F6D6